MCGGGSPPPPDYGPLAQASERVADRAFELGEQQLDWAKLQWADQKALLDDLVTQQTNVAREQYENAVADRDRYDDFFQPIEDDLVDDFRTYDSPERRELQAGRAAAAVTTAAGVQREEAARRLQSFGVDPSQISAGALDVQSRMQTAANAAGAANQERNRVEDKGRALRAEAINIGRGLPSQVAASYGQTLDAGNSSIGNMNNTLASQSNLRAASQGYTAQGMQGLSQSANIQNMGYQNQLAAYQADQSLGGIGQLAGAAMGAFMNAGGEVPGDASAIPSPEDKYPTMLAEGEYVIPAEVMRWKGLEFFDKLTAKSRADQGLPEVPAGEAINATPTPPNGMNAGGQVPWDMPAVQRIGYDPTVMDNMNAQTAALAQEGANFRKDMAMSQQAEMSSAVNAGRAGRNMRDAYKERNANKEDTDSAPDTRSAAIEERHKGQYAINTNEMVA